MNNVRKLWLALGLGAEAIEALALFVLELLSHARERLELPAHGAAEPVEVEAVPKNRLPNGKPARAAK